MANLFLQFGSGPNKLPEPWLNHDSETDIRERLPFDDGSARFVFAEHVIEHVQFLEGLFFLSEAYRVLSVGGVLRVSFPDVVKLASHPLEWAKTLQERGVIQAGREVTPAQVTMLVAAGFGHKMAWTEALMYLCLLGTGFRRVLPLAYGASQYAELLHVDGHHVTAGNEAARLETTVFEATK